ncbi:MAG: hypothetical protein K0R69_2883 [Clostridia bacterium]|nr:hypothetical protein [Clostridia bacterium]
MESTERIIGFENSLVISLVVQIISTVLMFGMVILMIYLCVLGIRALRIYIKKNS